MKPGDGLQHLVDHIWLARFGPKELFKSDDILGVAVCLFAEVIRYPEIMTPQEMSLFSEGHILYVTEALAGTERAWAVILEAVINY